ncbi:rhomboid family intramembrane serine protease [Streptomyces sp. SID3343]|uniref:rhomboid family intramembrane serine protease n=1 Tax=Streptomyces sp. SID3343 TaxID=2690260 RepID=UPI00136BA412|nr:rhomboid family intramembrane serine protease [Streptomyces sp. SID3343]MYW01527.1 rhomboid family intramembrane serine protease [Streptomyces sp. SID3343]
MARISVSGVRDAVLVTGVLVATVWVVQLINYATDDSLVGHGITPRRADELPDILTAPFLHFGTGHIVSNTFPLMVLGFLAALRGVLRFLGVLLLIIVTGGLGVWLVSPSGSNTAGASILVFGLFGYLLVRGFADRRVLDIVVGLVVLGYYGSSFALGVTPLAQGVSWQGHLFGLLGGVLAALVLRRRRDVAQVSPDGVPIR